MKVVKNTKYLYRMMKMDRRPTPTRGWFVAAAHKSYILEPPSWFLSNRLSIFPAEDLGIEWTKTTFLTFLYGATCIIYCRKKNLLLANLSPFLTNIHFIAFVYPRKKREINIIPQFVFKVTKFPCNNDEEVILTKSQICNKH